MMRTPRRPLRPPYEPSPPHPHRAEIRWHDAACRCTPISAHASSAEVAALAAQHPGAQLLFRPAPAPDALADF